MNHVNPSGNALLLLLHSADTLATTLLLLCYSCYNLGTIPPLIQTIHSRHRAAPHFRTIQYSNQIVQGPLGSIGHFPVVPG